MLNLLNQLSKFIETNHFYLLPVLKAIRQMPDYIENIDSKMKSAIEHFKSFNLEEPIMEEINNELNSFFEN